MGVHKVKKAIFTVHISILNDVLEYLQDLGISHIDEETVEFLKNRILENKEIGLNDLKRNLSKEEENIKEIVYELDKIFQFVSTNLKNINFNAEEKIVLSNNEFKDLIHYFDGKNIIKTISDKIDNILKNNEEISKLIGKIEHLKPFYSIPFDISIIKDTDDFIVRFYVINNQKYNLIVDEIDKFFSNKSEEDKLKENISTSFNLWSLEKISNINSDIYFALICEKNIYKDIFGIIRKFGGEEVSVEEEKGIISEIIKEYEKKILFYEEENNKLINDIEIKFKNYKNNLLAYYDYYYSLLSKLQIEESFLASDSFVVFPGWVLKKDIDKLNRIKEKFIELEIEYEDPSPDEVVPIAYKNKKIIKPYEMITNLYSPPKNGEIDPTPLFTPFFALFFAICTGDAGYGLLLSIASFFLMKKYEGETKQLFGVLFQVGILSIIVGALMGSFFGFTPNFLKKITIINSMDSPLTLFGLALLLGVIQLLCSYFIGFVICLSQGSIKKAFGEYFSYMLLIVSIVFLLLPLININVNPVITRVMTYIFITGIILVILFMGAEDPKSDRFLKKFFGVYGLTGIIGDILSYSRLLALSLSSGVIAMVINTLAKMFIGEGKSITGYISAIIILIIGHTFNILIGALGAFVHSMRLQYVEFFKQFYEGGGKSFTPFSKVYRYIKIKNNL